MNRLVTILPWVILSWRATAQTTIDLQTQVRGSSLIPQYRTGAGAPTDNCTAGRDYHLDTANSHLYFCRATNVWQRVLRTGEVIAASQGGLGVDASGLSGVMKIAGGAASIVTGSAADCVKVDGSSGACGGGGVSGGGSVNAGLAGEFAHYGTNGTAITGLPRMAWDSVSGEVRWKDSGGTVRAKLNTLAGLLTEGIGMTAGLSRELGNAGDSGASSFTARGGDGAGNAEPGFFSAWSSDPSMPFRSYLFPCGSAGNWCMTGSTPAADSTDHILSAANTKTVQNKTFDNTNQFSGYADWTQVAAPLAPASGKLRQYAKTGGGICWKDSAGNEVCPGAGTKGTVQFVLDGGGFEITTGAKGWVRVPYAGTITGVEVTADQAGSIVVDLWKDSFANFPPTIADTVTGSAKPTLSSAQKSQDTTLTGWTRAVAEGDYIRMNVDSASTVQYVVVSLQITRN